MFSVLVSLKNELELDRAIDKLTRGPREILRLDKVSIEEGSLVRLAIFNPEDEWTMDDKTNRSKSLNSPFWNKQLKGKSIGIIIGNKIKLNI